MRLEKVRDGATGELGRFQLSVVEVGADAGGNPVTSCIVDWVKRSPQQSQRPLAHTARSEPNPSLLDQGTLSEWWTLRGKPTTPSLYNDGGTLDEMVEALAADNWTYCFIDGLPYEQDLIEMSTIIADAVLIPVKLSYFDATTITAL